MSKTSFALVMDAFEILSAENQKKIVDHSMPISVRWGSGSTAGKANSFWSDRRSLTATSEVIDLNALTDGNGAIITWSTIKLILIRNRNLVAGEDLEWGPDATNGWGVGGIVADVSDRRVVPSGRTVSDMGIDFWVDPIGHAVGDGATDEIFVDAGAATIAYDILIIGTD